MSNSSKQILLRNKEEAIRLLGKNHEHVKLVQSHFPVKIVDRGEKVLVSGPDRDVEIVQGILGEVLQMVRRGNQVGTDDIRYALRSASDPVQPSLSSVIEDTIAVSSGSPPIRPKSKGQSVYVEAIREADVVFGIGPAGTGKTYLAVAMAVSSFLQRKYERMIFTRPAVEAGEKLGFLPGDLQEKVNPYLRPLYDALYDMMEADTISRLLSKGQIEVAPLAFMRGRTLNHCFVILDEAQNTTHEQMKMFLTRLGHDSKAIITGDITQIDLPAGKGSGLVEAQQLLSDIEGIRFVYFTTQDIFRHPLVAKIVDAYERQELSRRGE
ncbi:MAG: PhoH family protein [Candidatus Abyssobacteria bacterium SURF_5]|uniref:PhoH-like protein n=1 Tax=Abyssobacteria bacterium (strain SURF_5) TaxID=2093360 RepID=A0A3A4NIZ7_ABYX5|nr:MAG: PhoH family protein [Candidatus Abyssubacteria bacterium SURF_5]